MRRDAIPFRSPETVFFVKSNSSIEQLTFPEAVLVAADSSDRRTVFVAYHDASKRIQIDRAGHTFTNLAKRAVRSAQERDERPGCHGFTQGGNPCRAVSVTEWRDIPVCAMHDPDGEFARTNPDFRERSFMMLRSIKANDVTRLENRLTALLLERYGPSKGRGVIG